MVVIGLATVAGGGGGVDAGRVLDFKEGESLVAAIFGGAGLAFFALIGFEDSVNLAEEAGGARARLPACALQRAF